MTDDQITLNPGEGVIVYSSKPSAQFQVAGSVQLTPFTGAVVKGYQFGGNCTPATLSLSTIACTKSDGSAWLRTGAAANACNGAVRLQKIDSEGAYGQRYIYYGRNAADTFGPGWYVGERATDGSNLVTSQDDVTFAPGEGWIMYSSKDAANIVIPSAVSN